MGVPIDIANDEERKHAALYGNPYNFMAVLLTVVADILFDFRVICTYTHTYSSFTPCIASLTLKCGTLMNLLTISWWSHASVRHSMAKSLSSISILISSICPTTDCAFILILMAFCDLVTGNALVKHSDRACKLFMFKNA